MELKYQRYLRFMKILSLPKVIYLVWPAACTEKCKISDSAVGYQADTVMQTLELHVPPYGTVSCLAACGLTKVEILSQLVVWIHFWGVRTPKPEAESFSSTLSFLG